MIEIINIENGKEEHFSGKTYEDGLLEAWELAKKITCNIRDGGFSASQLQKIFGFNGSSDVFVNYTSQEAAAKITEWESKKEIRFRDEVIYCGDDNMRGVVTKENLIDSNDKCCVLWNNGEVGWPSKSSLTKTGRTIDIAGLLEQIGGTE